MRGGESLHSFVSLVTTSLTQIVFPVFCFSFNWKKIQITCVIEAELLLWNKVEVIPYSIQAIYSIDLSARPIVMAYWWGREIADPNASFSFNSHVNSLYLSCNTLTCFFLQDKTINYHVNILVTTDVSGCKGL